MNSVIRLKLQRERENSDAVSDEAGRRVSVINARILARKGEFAERLSLIQSSRADDANKLRALQRLADDIGALAADGAACQRGCTHCCHIPVEVLPAEARAIGKATRIQPMPRPDDRASGFVAHLPLDNSEPCPWLAENGDCSIYAVRPIACRTHFLIDDSPLLCELNGEPVQAPFMDMRAIRSAAIGCLGVGSDIRYWFAHVERGALTSDWRERRAAMVRQVDSAHITSVPASALLEAMHGPRPLATRD